MTSEEHIAESRDSARTAERLYRENRPLQGAEITWRSVKHAINAIGVQRGLRYHSYQQKKWIVRLLQREEGHLDLEDQLGQARRLHVDSDHGLLDAQQVSEARAVTAVLVERLLAIAVAR